MKNANNDHKSGDATRSRHSNNGCPRSPKSAGGWKDFGTIIGM